MSALQQDSKARITRYQTLKEEALKQGDAKLAKARSKEIADEQKILKMIIRVERLNSTGELEGYMEHFRRSRSADLVAV